MGINTFNLNSTPSAKQRGLQNGTPKMLPAGEARACYAMLSYNVAQASGGVVFFDKHFQPVRPSSGNPGANTNVASLGNGHFAGAGDAQHYAGLLGASTTTANQPSSSAAALMLNSTNSAGEFGNTGIDVYSNSSPAPVAGRSTDRSVKSLMNATFFNSDHADRAIVYLLNGPLLRAVSRIDGDNNFDYFNTAAYSIPGVHASMYGSASYNAARKELVVLSYAAAGGSYTLSSFQGIDFDKYPSPAAAFADTAVVRVDRAVVFPSWVGADGESLYSVKPTLTDDGSVFVSVFTPAASLRLYKVSRGADLAILSTSMVAQKAVTTSYGRDQGVAYGQRTLQSRDGGAVMCFSQYYYYGAGMVSFVVDKRKSSYLSTTMLESADTAAGYIPMPYGDSGFASYYCGNVYSTSYAGGYVIGCVERGANGVIVQTASAFLLPYFPMPNTTNYPGFTQVTDYSMVDNQAFY